MESDKSGLVRNVFTNVASRYDVMNDIMSAGVHRLWKNGMLDWLAPRPGQELIDVAGGTGDIAFEFIKRAKGSAKATVVDLTESMVNEGKKRAGQPNTIQTVQWICGDAMQLPFADKSFDVYTISFGIRNVTDIGAALSEAYRVLRPGGRLMVLEFSRVDNEILSWMYDRYSFSLIPLMGEIIAGDRKSYQYLVESIRKFPDQDDFLEMIKLKGFKQVKFRNLSFGVAALHSAWKI
ncbi:MAG: bifunctional demethylmenaquinone methyltransferase/2-methoxy-6-polyprenyl-1,4-benzoquinol methylase UbiE [Rhodobacteraceae bacterium]|nr:bifunctional demethylmenaquinone methyltransferase/2-methoxy-6-polyprenyl-1,4-benzoquinol methylase UbiE [Paracoccaceae bacterium]|tara:strand:+ start:1575 stop:2282 length:708 start_codon:yes stop_codon:yes gene_type:complete